jgi:hypothetical protein
MRNIFIHHCIENKGGGDEEYGDYRGVVKAPMKTGKE